MNDIIDSSISSDKKGKKINEEITDIKIPEVNIQIMKSILSGEIDNESKWENIFQIKGTMHLSCYLAINEKMIMKDVLEMLAKDVDL